MDGWMDGWMMCGQDQLSGMNLPLMVYIQPMVLNPSPRNHGFIYNPWFSTLVQGTMVLYTTYGSQN
jgi:hypothetical protein